MSKYVLVENNIVVGAEVECEDVSVLGIGYLPLVELNQRSEYVIPCATYTTSEDSVSVVYAESEAVNTYSFKRAKAYPGMLDQLDMLWHAMDIGTALKSEPFYTIIKNVKDTYPK